MDLVASVVLDIWELVIEYIPSSRKEDVANKMIKIFADKGLDEDDFKSIKGEDTYLDAAIDNFCETSDDDYDYFDAEYDDD